MLTSTIYVLILFAGATQKGGPAMHDFESKAACEFAGEEFTKLMKSKWYGFAYYTCVPKG